MFIVDAHEDLAMNVTLFGRDYTQSTAQTRAAEQGTSLEKVLGRAMLGWSDWLQGGVGLIFATLFVPPTRPDDTFSLSPHHYGSPEEAQHYYQLQLQTYHQLVADHPDKFCLIQTQADLDTHLQAWQGSQTNQRPVGMVILMEGAEGILQPHDVGRWFEQGVRVIGPAWTRTRYAGGTKAPGPLTDLGRLLLHEMAQHNILLDLTHLTDEGVDEALDLYTGPIVATHSNCRALLGDDPTYRQLTDSAIRRLAERDGVQGIVLANPFLQAGIEWTDTHTSVQLEAVLAQIDYVCQLTGSTAHVGLGSDFDGGFGSEITPVGLDTVADLPRIGEALSQRGYDDDAVEAIMGQNWLRVLRRGLP